MDPVTVGAVLLAIVSGASGELGSQLWAGVSALVRRPFRHRQAAQGTEALGPTGPRELAALKRAPADERRAMALAEALIARAEANADFQAALEGWWEEAKPVRNAISGGTFYGQVL